MSASESSALHSFPECDLGQGVVPGDMPEPGELAALNCDHCQQRFLLACVGGDLHAV